MSHIFLTKVFNPPKKYLMGLDKLFCLIFPMVALEQHIQWKITLNWLILLHDTDVWWPKTMRMTNQYFANVPIPRTGSHYHDQWQVTSEPPLPRHTIRGHPQFTHRNNWKTLIIFVKLLKFPEQALKLTILDSGIMGSPVNIRIRPTIHFSTFQTHWWLIMNILMEFHRE